MSFNLSFKKPVYSQCADLKLFLAFLLWSLFREFWHKYGWSLIQVQCHFRYRRKIFWNKTLHLKFKKKSMGTSVSCKKLLTELISLVLVSWQVCCHYHINKSSKPKVISFQKNIYPSNILQIYFKDVYDSWKITYWVTPNVWLWEETVCKWPL